MDQTVKVNKAISQTKGDRGDYGLTVFFCVCTLDQINVEIYWARQRSPRLTLTCELQDDKEICICRYHEGQIQPFSTLSSQVLILFGVSEEFREIEQFRPLNSTLYPDDVLLLFSHSFWDVWSLHVITHICSHTCSKGLLNHLMLGSYITPFYLKSMCFLRIQHKY